jgi:GNAT superfamily N-acetyltransferase
MRVVRFVFSLKTKKPKEARLALLGVRPEYRNSGIAALFYAESLLRGKHLYKGGELSWVEENNEEIIKGIRLMGAEPYKRYRLFEGATV